MTVPARVTILVEVLVDLFARLHITQLRYSRKKGRLKGVPPHFDIIASFLQNVVI